jgi:hypothetical protein
MLSQKTMQSLRYLSGLLIIMGFFVFGACPVRIAKAGGANVIPNHTCTGYTSEEISLFQDGTSSVNPSLPLLAVPVTTVFPAPPLFNKINVLRDEVSAPGLYSIPIYLRDGALLI